MDPDSFREDLLKGIVAQALDNFKENLRITGVIEDKAQKCAALAGAFLAAGLAFLKKENFSEISTFGGYDTLLFLSLSILALVCCIGFCLAVLWVKRNPSPLPIEWLSSVTEEILSLPGDRLTSEVQRGHWWLLIHALNDKLHAQAKGNEDRAKSLKIAQGVLSVAIVLVAFASLSILFNVGLSRLASLSV